MSNPMPLYINSQEKLEVEKVLDNLETGLTELVKQLKTSRDTVYVQYSLTGNKDNFDYIESLIEKYELDIVNLGKLKDRARKAFLANERYTHNK